MSEFPTQETLTIEFKSDRGGGYPDSDLVDEIVGMANTEGGTLYLGIEDNGQVTGIVKHHQDPIGLAALIAIVRGLPYLCVQKLFTIMICLSW